MTIGVFDSGLGGLTVLKELERALPSARFVYLGDTAHLPYGTKSPHAIRRFLEENIRWLAKQQPRFDAIVIACVTASSVYADADRKFRLYIEKLAGTKVIDVLTPAFSWIKENIPRDTTLGFIGTPATVERGVAGRALKEYALCAQACALLVPIIEEGWLKHRVLGAVLEEYLQPLKDAGVSKLVLGCTHYPIIADQIRAIIGDEVELVNLGAALALQIPYLLPPSISVQDVKSQPIHRFYVTDKPHRFSEISSMILGRAVEADLVHIP